MKMPTENEIQAILKGPDGLIAYFLRYEDAAALAESLNATTEDHPFLAEWFIPDDPREDPATDED